MNFDHAMHFVESEHGFPSRPEERHARRLAWLLDRSGLGDALRPVRRAIVAGSCGKASTARLLAFIVRALFDRLGEEAPVGLGTKPPLRETPDGQRERYQRLDAAGPRWISRADFARIASELAPWVHALRRAAPELGAPAAYELRAWILARHFTDVGAAFGVVEANIGLLDDATGALPAPAVQVLTPVGDDHASVLVAPADAPSWLAGLGERAGPVWHKAGGLFAGVPTVVGAQAPEVRAAIEALARARGAGPLYLLDRDFSVHDQSCTLDGSTARLELGDRPLPVTLAAIGRFQVDNAAVAAMTATVLQRVRALPGSPDDMRAAITAGLARVDMPGRMQRVASSPTTILTVGATRIKAEGTVSTLRDLLAGGRVVLCLTEMARVEGARRAVEILGEIPGLSAAVTTRVERNGENADADPATLASWLRAAHPALRVRAIDDPDEAIAVARTLADPARDVVLLVGNGLGAHLSERGSRGPGGRRRLAL